MARRGHVYPQVQVAAGDLVNARMASASASASSGEALARVRAAGAVAVVLGGRVARVVLREDLARAVALGLEELPAAALARPVPAVAPQAPEGQLRLVRRRGAAPVVRVGTGSAVEGAVIGLAGPPVVALANRFARALPDAARDVLEAAGAAAAAHGGRAFAVGGLVRDTLRGGVTERVDLDIAVEGDGLGVARALAGHLGGEVVEHRRFLTASVTGTSAGRVDVATCRSERYETPGALPRVMPATIEEDLARRDFSVNALAVDLSSGAFDLLDLLGGRRDLARGRLRVLHPLSFVEDPTRMFRAARYAERLGFALDAWSARSQALALRLAPYAALSGERMASELERVLADVRPAATLTRLGRAGVFRLLDPRYRFDDATKRRLAQLPVTLDWTRGAGVPVSGLELLGLALTASQPRGVAEACLARLALRGEPLARLLRAREDATSVAARLRTAAGAAARTRTLADRASVELAWLRLTGDEALRGVLDAVVTAGRAARPVLRGDEVIALGVPRGPQVARVLTALRDARLDGAVHDRTGEAAWVRAWVRAERPEAKEG
jgi:tRNA nucleotidyltransferase (CCA-adding enzyme)